MSELKSQMRRYLVGGAVRDQLLGHPVRENDWLVTGCTPEELVAQGYQQVGQQFPVFLHPDTHEEHALPRGEDGAGSDLSATIEQDLQRRDLTINAMAMDDDQHLIDPLNGKADLDNRVLRHTPSFAQDPIRVLRLARFQARYAELGFSIAPETEMLIQAMVHRGELDQLVAERVFAEFAKAMQERSPRIFIKALRKLHALAVFLPEVDCLFGIPQPSQYHPEIDTGLHSLMVLDQACILSAAPEVRFAALLHDVGKGTTPETEWPRHIGHENRGVPLIETISKRLRLPNPWRDLAIAASRYHLHCHRAFELRPKTLLKMLTALDAFRKSERFENFLIVCEADMRGRTGFETKPYPQRKFMLGAFRAAAEIIPAQVIRPGSQGKQIAEQIRRARLAAVTAFKSDWGASG